MRVGGVEKSPIPTKPSWIEAFALFLNLVSFSKLAQLASSTNKPYCGITLRRYSPQFALPLQRPQRDSVLRQRAFRPMTVHPKALHE